MDHEPLPMWILLGHDMTDDTMFVICHWHYKPEQKEIQSMIDSVGDKENLAFRMAEIGAN